MESIAAAAACLRDEADVRQVVREIVEDAQAAGVVWLEVSVWPGLFAGRQGDYRAAITAVLETDRAAAGELGVGFGLIAAAKSRGRCRRRGHRCRRTRREPGLRGLG